jgi:hypothetical protein
VYERNGVSYETYGAYLRSKNLNVDTGLDGRKAWDGEIQAYKDAHRQGIRPAGTRMPQIRAAVEKSDKAGKAYDASTGGFRG